MTGVELFTLAGTKIFLADALAVVGGLASAFGAAQGGQAEAASADFQAQVQQQQAESERQVGEADAEDFRRRQRALLASSRAKRGASGVDPTAGSSLLVDEAIVAEIALGAGRIGQGGQMRATRLEQEAALSKARGANAKQAGFRRAGTSLLGTAASFA